LFTGTGFGPGLPGMHSVAKVNEGRQPSEGVVHTLYKGVCVLCRIITGVPLTSLKYFSPDLTSLPLRYAVILSVSRCEIWRIAKALGRPIIQ
jgi:hypothetical protein